ncbi:MAG: serine/threonine protein kinase [Bacteriovoracaceae bacterium]|nr:serine/threonine protein kinase [Bacteriovoracaceae bacterium]
MTDKKFERFGKYLILDHLVDGGMAKICRARFLGEQSNKVVAIKMVQPQFSKDPNFVRMFQDELSVCFGLLHPNIAQTYDYGKVNEQLYTAMEYVDGANLKQFLDRLKEKNFVFPVEISVYIISQVCQGLHYAHTFTEKLSGQPLNIVHRDISPHNVMLTYDGAVKVIDFGIAKSNSNSEATQAGTIKGKLSYLAPEYLEGLELDARYDEFAVGITLWEMLCSRKMFTAANDLAVLKQIQACKIAPPSSINPNVPKELDAIVMKALSKDRSQRYEDMDKFNRALVKFLYSQYPDFNPSDLSYFAKELFKDEIKRDKEKFVEYGKIDVQPYIDDLNKDQNGKPAAPAAFPMPNASGGEQLVRQERIEIDLDEPSSSNEEGSATIELATSSPQTSTRKVARASLSKEKAKTSTSIKMSKRTDKTSTSSNKTMSRSKKDLEKGEKESSSSVSVIFILVASLCGVAYFQGDFMEEMIGINLHKMIHGEGDRTISSVSNPSVAKETKVAPQPQLPKEGTITLGGVDFDMEVLINGQKQAYVSGTAMKVPLDQNITVMVKKAGYKSFMKTIALTAEENSVFVQVPEPVRARTGLLSSSLNYGAGSILIFEVDGEKIEKTMPFRDIAIPSGSYQAKVINPALGTEKEIEFLIEENKMQLLP